MQTLQLATLVDEAPEGDQWLHEQKFDGYRILVTKDGSKVELHSRRAKAWTKMFPTIPAELFRYHNWRTDVETIGTVPAEFVADATETPTATATTTVSNWSTPGSG